MHGFALLALASLPAIIQAAATPHQDFGSQIIRRALTAFPTPVDLQLCPVQPPAWYSTAFDTCRFPSGPEDPDFVSKMECIGNVVLDYCGVPTSSSTDSWVQDCAQEEADAFQASLMSCDDTDSTASSALSTLLTKRKNGQDLETCTVEVPSWYQDFIDTCTDTITTNATAFACFKDELHERCTGLCLNIPACTEQCFEDEMETLAVSYNKCQTDIDDDDDDSSDDEDDTLPIIASAWTYTSTIATFTPTQASASVITLTPIISSSTSWTPATPTTILATATLLPRADFEVNDMSDCINACDLFDQRCTTLCFDKHTDNDGYPVYKEKSAAASNDIRTYATFAAALAFGVAAFFL